MAIVVGPHSCLNKIIDSLGTTFEKTALYCKLEVIATQISMLGMYCALLTIHALFFRFFIERFIDRGMDLFGGGEDSGPFYNLDGSLRAYCSEWIGYFILGITIVVVAVPEGLPLAVMISLAYSVKKMLMD